MVRHVRHELRAVIAAAAALAVAAVVLAVVRGLPALPGTWWRPVALMVAVLALWMPVRASRLKRAGEVRDFEAAVPLQKPPTGGDFLHRRPPSTRGSSSASWPRPCRCACSGTRGSPWSWCG